MLIIFQYDYKNTFCVYIFFPYALSYCCLCTTKISRPLIERTYSWIPLLTQQHFSCPLFTVLLCLPTGLVRLKWVETLGTLILSHSLLLNSEFYCLSLQYSLHGHGFPSSPCPALDMCAGVWRCSGFPVINLTAREEWCSVWRALCSTPSTLCVSFQQAHTPQWWAERWVPKGFG